MTTLIKYLNIFRVCVCLLVHIHHYIYIYLQSQVSIFLLLPSSCYSTCVDALESAKPLTNAESGNCRGMAQTCLVRAAPQFVHGKFPQGPPRPTRRGTGQRESINNTVTLRTEFPPPLTLAWETGIALCQLNSTHIRNTPNMVCFHVVLSVSRQPAPTPLI